MFDTFAHLVSEVFLRLGSPAGELLKPEQIVSVATEVLTKDGLITQQSEYARISKKTIISPAARDTLLSQVPDLMLPSSLERQVSSAPNTSWLYIPIANDADLESARIRGDGSRCAFTLEPDGMHLMLSYDPKGFTHRLTYCAEPQIARVMGDALDRGSRYGFLYTHETIVGCVPIIQMNASKLPPERRLTADDLQALSSTLAYSQSQIKELREIFDNEKDANRNAKGRNRRRILGGRGAIRRTTY